MLNPAIVVRDSFGSLLEHTENLLRALSSTGAEFQDLSQGAKVSKGLENIPGSPPQRQRNLSTGGDLTTSSVAEVVVSISMVIRYGEQLRNALGYMLVQCEHDDEKRKEMSAKLNKSSSSGRNTRWRTEGGQTGVTSLLDTDSGPSGGSNFIISSLSACAQ